MAAIGRQLLAEVVQISSTFVERLREQGIVAHVDDLSDAALQDHMASLLADLGQSLVLLEDSADDAAELLRDGSAIQRTVTDRHGRQRHRIGWSEAAFEKEFEILRDEVGRLVHSAAQDQEGADADRAMDFLTGFLEQSRRGSQRAFRMAARSADA